MGVLDFVGNALKGVGNFVESQVIVPIGNAVSESLKPGSGTATVENTFNTPTGRVFSTVLGGATLAPIIAYSPTLPGAITKIPGSLVTYATSSPINFVKSIAGAGVIAGGGLGLIAPLFNVTKESTSAVVGAVTGKGTATGTQYGDAIGSALGFGLLGAGLGAGATWVYDLYKNWNPSTPPPLSTPPPTLQTLYDRVGYVPSGQPSQPPPYQTSTQPSITQPKASKRKKTKKKTIKRKKTSRKKRK